MPRKAPTRPSRAKTVQSPPTVSEALEGALRAATLSDEDGAAVALARQYAQLIDSVPVALVEKSVGRDFLAVLTSLGMTPQARKAVMKGGSDAVVLRPVDVLRSRRSS